MKRLVPILIFLIWIFFFSEARAVDTPTVHLPYFQQSFKFEEAGIFWFGKVAPTDSYSDVRVGYTGTEMTIQIGVFDQQMWYDESPVANDLTNWDSASIFIETPDGKRYKFDSQVNFWQPRIGYQQAYTWQNNAWVSNSVLFTTTSGWRGESPNSNATEERGWVTTYTIPFTSLSSSPATDIRVGIVVHDKDTSSEQVRHAVWPQNFSEQDLASWGMFSFGMPSYSVPPITNEQTKIIRHKLNNQIVTDAMVGGDTVCGSGLVYWTAWGEANYSGSGHINVQNQSDIADWQCFSKGYFTFPMDQLPIGKTIEKATLKVYLSGNAGGAQDVPKPSFIQAIRANGAWNEQTITWNNAPYALENIGGTWVNPIDIFPGWPGVPYEWDVTKAVNDAYAEGVPANLILYSADSEYHSGKYFVTSESGDWNEVGRPTLTIIYGDSVNPSPTPTPTSQCKSRGDLNCSGKVDLGDLTALLSKFGLSDAFADVNGDGRVTLADLTTLLTNFGL